MPRIADLEIAATWDEIELEAALRGRAAAAPMDPAAEPGSCLTDALRALEALKQLPKEERKRRAEELLRALTSAPAAPLLEAEPAVESPAETAAPESPSELPQDSSAPSPPASDAPVGAEPSTATAEPSDDSPGADAVAVSADLALVSAAIAEAAAALSEISKTPVEDISGDTVAWVDAEPASEPAPIPEPIAASSEVPVSPVEEAPSTAAEPVVAQAAPEFPSIVEPVAASPEMVEAPAPDAPAPDAEAAAASTDVSPEPPAIPDTVAAASPSEPSVFEAPAGLLEALIAAASAPVVETAPEPAARSATTPPSDAIPRFLTAQYTALEPEQPDSLIPFRAVAAAGALIGAVLLVYFWSSQEFGVAARPIMGATETVAPAAAPKISASLAARQGFVAWGSEFVSALPQPRPRRPAMVGFDLFDAPASAPAPAAPAVISVKAEVTPVAPVPSAEVTIALPPAPSSDIAALIKRGDDLLKAGDVAAARSAYERAAAGGNAKAQIGVGTTYDPLVLSKLGARGVRGDPVQAAAWYARASEAGDAEGRQRLNALLSGLSDCMLSPGTCGARKP